MTTAAYILLVTLSLTEGGVIQAECDTSATSYQECSLIAKEHEGILRKEFTLTKKDKGLCPFRDVKIRCQKGKAR